MTTPKALTYIWGGSEVGWIPKGKEEEAASVASAARQLIRSLQSQIQIMSDSITELIEENQRLRSQARQEAGRDNTHYLLLKIEGLEMRIDELEGEVRRGQKSVRVRG